MLKGLGDDGLTGADIRDGLVAIVSVKIPDISFSSQTKDKLVTPRAKGLVEELFLDQVQHWFMENPGAARKIAERAVISAKAREAARRARDQVKRKEWMDPSSLPGKLADCQSRHPSECELFLVEGDSAGGSAKAARDRRFKHSALRGKVLNVERVALESCREQGVATSSRPGLRNRADTASTSRSCDTTDILWRMPTSRAHIRTLC